MRHARTPITLAALLALTLSACTGRLSSADLDEAGRPVGPGPAIPGANNRPGVNNTDPIKPVDPTDPTDPTDPIKPTDPPRKGEPFACSPGQRAPELPLRRLSMLQYKNTTRDLLRATLGEPQGQAAWGALRETLEKLPDDARRGYPGDTHGGFRSLDQTLQQQHVDVSLELAQAVAQQLTSSQERLGRVVGACATDNDPSNDAGCVQDFIRRFGELALRSPLDEDDVGFYTQVYDAQGLSVPGLRDVITTMLASPQHLYHVQHGQEPVLERLPQGAVHALTAHELASKLAYHFWQSAPDEALLQAARDGSLMTEAGYRAQLDRLIADERAEAMLRALFTEWLWTDELPRLDALVGTPVFDAFAGQQRPSAQLRAAMIDELAHMARYYTVDRPGSLDELLLSDHSFAADPELAALYGVQPWDGRSEPPRFRPGERAGLITRAALLTSGSANTRPIMKGFFIRKALLCVQPPPPPDNAADFRVDLSDAMTTREVVESITEQEGSSCAGCHKVFINPLGFATESYDALGRLRAEQTLFNAEGVRVGSRPVDTRGVPRIFFDDLTPVETPQELADMLVQSEEVHKCFARHYARFTFSRAEDLQADACALEDLRQQLVSGADMRQVLTSIALRPEFKQRQL